MPSIQLTVNGRARPVGVDAETPWCRMGDMPAVGTHVIASADAPSGMGEPPVPLAIPAVLNAAFAASGKRIQRLPLGPDCFQ